MKVLPSLLFSVVLSLLLCLPSLGQAEGKPNVLQRAKRALDSLAAGSPKRSSKRSSKQAAAPASTTPPAAQPAPAGAGRSQEPTARDAKEGAPRPAELTAVAAHAATNEVAVAPPPSTAPAPTKNAYRTLREVDWRTYGPAAPLTDEQRAEAESVGDATEPSSMLAVVYGDLDGDGLEEAAVTYSHPGSGGMASEMGTFDFYRLRDGKVVALQQKHEVSSTRSSGPTFQYVWPRSIVIKDGLVTQAWNQSSSFATVQEEPEAISTSLWRLSGDALQRVPKNETTKLVGPNLRNATPSPARRP